MKLALQSEVAVQIKDCFHRKTKCVLVFYLHHSLGIVTFQKLSQSHGAPLTTRARHSKGISSVGCMVWRDARRAQDRETLWGFISLNQVPSVEMPDVRLTSLISQGQIICEIFPNWVSQFQEWGFW